MKKFFAALLIILFVIMIVCIIWNFVPVSNGLVFDLRQGKTPSNPNELFFDNFPRIGNETYSGIFVGDSVVVSGVSPKEKIWKSRLKHFRILRCS